MTKLQCGALSVLLAAILAANVVPLLTPAPQPPEAPKPPRISFEYKIADVPDLLFDKQMKSFGDDGWDLIFARRAGSSGDMNYEAIFKRTVSTPAK